MVSICLRAERKALWRSQTSFSWNKREEKETRGKGERENVKARAFGQVFRNLRGKVMDGIRRARVYLWLEESGKDLE